MQEVFAIATKTYRCLINFEILCVQNYQLLSPSFLKEIRNESAFAITGHAHFPRKASN